MKSWSRFMAPSDVDDLRLHWRRRRGASYPHRRQAALAGFHVQILFRQARTAVRFDHSVGRDDMRRQQHAPFSELGNQHRIAIVNLGALEVVARDLFDSSLRLPLGQDLWRELRRVVWVGLRGYGE